MTLWRAVRMVWSRSKWHSCLEDRELLMKLKMMNLIKLSPKKNSVSITSNLHVILIKWSQSIQKRISLSLTQKKPSKELLNLTLQNLILLRLTLMLLLTLVFAMISLSAISKIPKIGFSRTKMQDKWQLLLPLVFCNFGILMKVQRQSIST